MGPECRRLHGLPGARRVKKPHRYPWEAPADARWERAQSFFVHPMIFGEFRMGDPERAAIVAMRIIDHYPDKTPLADSDGEESNTAWRSPKALHEILLHLWAIENGRATKVHLSDPPNSEVFDERAQTISRKLDGLGGTTNEASPRTEGSPRTKRRKRARGTALRRVRIGRELRVGEEPT